MRKIQMAQEHVVKGMTSSTMEPVVGASGEVIYNQDVPRLRHLHIVVNEVAEREMEGAKAKVLKRSKPQVFITCTCQKDMEAVLHTLEDFRKDGSGYEGHVFFGAGGSGLEMVKGHWEDRKMRRSRKQKWMAKGKGEKQSESAN